ncbi:putative short chain dehydrogenase/ reductase [Geopyxis carbonaria]|nr:putative short chain dehydrogenase/ reductase [Geopyxis carbonaria]
MDISGKTAIITGGGSGINLSFAKLLASKQCNVVIGDLALTPEAEAFVGSEQPPNTRVLFQRTDVTSWPDLAALFTVARERLNTTADIVVPGAGVYEPAWSSFFHGDEAGTPESRYRSLDINLTHPIALTRMAFSEFLAARKRQAAVIHVSSVAGQCPRFTTPIYVAAKHGINGFVRSLGPQMEENFNIRVSAVAPGVIKTRLWMDHPDKLQMIDETQDEWATPEEVAEGMLMLLECTDLPGGTILEVGKGQRRLVTHINDRGPSGAGHTVSNGQVLDDETIKLLKRERDGT